ncbi:MAG: thymidylate kinase [Candidatus Nanohaloarchaea archaeon]|jgi:thymidylate kinase
MSQDSGNFFVFEGLDGVGKSSVAEAFAEEIDAVFMESPGPGISEIREYVDRPKHSNQTQFLMYMASNSAVSDQVEAHLSEGGDVVLDRYYPTTVVYNELDEKDSGRWYEAVEEFDLIEPDHMFYLWTDRQTRVERKSGRVETGSDGKDADVLGPQKAEKEYEEAVERYDMTRIEAINGVENVVENIMMEADLI